MKPWRTTEARMLLSGLSGPQIAERIGRSRDAVRHYAASHGVRLPRRRARIVPAMKSCRGPCGAWLRASAFYAEPRNADGLAGTCAECQREAARARHRATYVPLNTMRQTRNASGQFTRAA